MSEDSAHVIEFISLHAGSASTRWKCSCGASCGGLWFASPEEARKRANQHIHTSK